MCIKIGNIVRISKIKRKSPHIFLGKKSKVISFGGIGFQCIDENNKIELNFYFNNENNCDYEYELIREENLKYILKCLK